MTAPSVCHGPPVTRPQTKRTIAPCGATIRGCTGAALGDSWSASLRFMTCKKCRRLGLRGKFPLAWWWREQTRMRFREQLAFPV